MRRVGSRSLSGKAVTGSDTFRSGNEGYIVLQQHFRFLGQRPLKALFASGALVGFGVFAPGVMAAITPVTGPANLGATVPIPVQPGDVWNLSGVGIYLATPVTLPVGALSINGDGTNPLTLNSGGAYGRLVGPNLVFGAYTLNLSNITLTGGLQQNTTGGAVGILETNAANTLTINTTGAVTFSNNSVASTGSETRGGAVYAYQPVTINGDNAGGAITFTGNSTGVGSSGTIVSSGGAVYSGADVQIGDAKSVVALTNNYAEYTTSAVTTGGAVGAGNLVNIQGGEITISGNKAGAAGGAISTAGASGITIGNAGGGSNTVKITDNRAYNNTGGALDALNGPVTVTGQHVTVTGNTAASNGGAIWSTRTGAGILGVKIDGQQIAVDDNSSSGGQGGAIFARGRVEIGNADSTTVTLSDNSSAYPCASRGGGGAIGTFGDPAIPPSYVAPVTIDGDSIAINGNSLTSGAGCVGGAIYTDGPVTIGHASSSAVTLDGNAITGSGGGWGGAIYSDTVALNGKTIKLTNNSATSSGGGVNVASGATIGNAAGDSAVTLSGNSAKYGGAIYSTAPATTITGNTVAIANNSASGYAGAIAAGGALTITGAASITGNSSGDYGGAILSYGNLTITGAASITGNSASSFGGAIMADANLALNATTGNITFSGNKANGQPNAIWFNNSASGAAATFNTAGRTITFADPIANNATTGPLGVTATGGGAVVFNGGQASPLYGATVVGSGTTFAVQGGASYGALQADLTGATGSGSTFTVSSGATLAGGSGGGQVRADSFDLESTLNISGGLPSSGNVFTVTSPNPIFGASAKVLINTNLSDASAAQTDKLVVDLAGGALATGATVKVFVTNTGTVARGNDFLLVEVKNAGAATLPAGTFTLAAPLPGDYELVQGDGANVNNWYLHSPTVGQIPPAPNAAPIPALNHLALALLAALLLAGAAVGARRKH